MQIKAFSDLKRLEVKRNEAQGLQWAIQRKCDELLSSIDDSAGVDSREEILKAFQRVEEEEEEREAQYQALLRETADDSTTADGMDVSN